MTSSCLVLVVQSTAQSCAAQNFFAVSKHVEKQRVKKLSRCANHAVRCVTLFAATMMLVPTPAIAQDAPGETRSATESLFPKTPPPRKADTEEKPSLSEQQTRQAKQWLELLASNQFAQRERAAESLVALDDAVVPLLREYIKQTGNAEVKLRVKTLIKYLNDGDLQARLDAFANGEDVGFESWPIFRNMFGGSGKSRDLFVALVKDYPTLIESFLGTPRDRAKAMVDITTTLATKRQTIPFRLEVADAIALLLPVRDAAVPLGEDYERQMLMVLRMSPATQAPRDPIIGRAFTDLLNAWVRRSTAANRESVFHFALQSNLTSAYPLAQKTIGESDEPRVLAIAMQVIARTARLADVRLIEPFLEDDRELLVILHTRSKQSRVRMRDVAMATMAKIFELPLVELGYPSSAENARFGFIYDDLIFREDGASPLSIEEQRGAAMAKIKQLIQNSRSVEAEKF